MPTGEEKIHVVYTTTDASGSFAERAAGAVLRGATRQLRVVDVGGDAEIEVLRVGLASSPIARLKPSIQHGMN